MADDREIDFADVLVMLVIGGVAAVEHAAFTRFEEKGVERRDDRPRRSRAPVAGLGRAVTFSSPTSSDSPHCNSAMRRKPRSRIKSSV